MSQNLPAIPTSPALAALGRDYTVLARSTKVPEDYVSAISQEEWDGFTEDFRIKALIFLDERLIETTDDTVPRVPKIQFPTAGSKRFTMPGGDDVLNFEAVLAFKARGRGLWLTETGELNTEPKRGQRPTCSSWNMIEPDPARSIKVQAAKCADCRWSQWKSGKGGRGKGCRERINNFLILSKGDDIPTLFSVPPTSIGNYSDYALACRTAKPKIAGGIYGCVTRFDLDDKTNPDGPDYKVLKLSIVGHVPILEQQRIYGIRQKFEDFMRRRGVEAEEAVEHPADAVPQAPGEEEIPF